MPGLYSKDRADGKVSYKVKWSFKEMGSISITFDDKLDRLRYFPFDSAGLCLSVFFTEFKLCERNWNSVNAIAIANLVQTGRAYRND